MDGECGERADRGDFVIHDFSCRACQCCIAHRAFVGLLEHVFRFFDQAFVLSRFDQLGHDLDELLSGVVDIRKVMDKEVLQGCDCHGVSLSIVGWAYQLRTAQG
jgi:hypothetical protein